MCRSPSDILFISIKIIETYTSHFMIFIINIWCDVIFQNTGKSVNVSTKLRMDEPSKFCIILYPIDFIKFYNIVPKPTIDGFFMM